MVKPIRWLLNASHVPPGGSLGGIVRYTVELARALENHEDVELHLMTSPEAEASLADEIGCGGRTVPVSQAPGPLASLVERYALGRRVQGFDVYQGTKHLLPRGVAARSVLTVHDLLLLDRPQDFPPAKRYLLGRPYAASLRQADHLVCVSRATERRLLEWDPRLAGRTSAVPLATSPALLAATPEAVTAVEGRPFALVVGDSQPRKNVSTVVTAWRRVVAVRPGAVLVLIGPPAWGKEAYGPDYSGLVQSGNVLQLTGVGDGTLRWCYENASVVLAPSLAEGFGLPAVEALDLGAPLVTSRDAALVEASGPAVEHIPAHDVAAWARAALAHIVTPVEGVRERRTPRTWDDLAAETVEAVLADGTRRRVVQLPSDRTIDLDAGTSATRTP
jgi:glycosyltransferase involved in cell wall biosynthesis